MILEFANFQHLHFYGFDIYSCPEIEYKLLFINIFDPTVNLVITHSTILQPPKTIFILKVKKKKLHVDVNYLLTKKQLSTENVFAA